VPNLAQLPDRLIGIFWQFEVSLVSNSWISQQRRVSSDSSVSESEHIKQLYLHKTNNQYLHYVWY